MKVHRVRIDAGDPQSIVDQVTHIMRVLDQLVEFGDPQDPGSDGSTALAGTTHNGRMLNVRGSFVELVVENLNTATTCTHNLNVQLLSASQPNVRWLVFGYQHNATGAAAANAVSVVYVDGDTVGTNAIQLRFYAIGWTVNAANPLRVCLWFMPAVRGIAQP